MDKLLFLTAFVTTILVVHGEKFNFQKLMNRRDPFPEANPPPPGRAVVANFITQRLDNFDPTNNQTWQQRYFMNGELFQPGGCIFIFLGEYYADRAPQRLESSLMYEMSREFECYMFYLQHRFYSESRPTENTSNGNLRFMNVDQALADIAHFVRHIKSKTVTPGAQNSPVIVLGGLYTGSLAVWFRQSYPHLAIGAWASSAPTYSVVDHFQYKELVGAVYRHIGGSDCYDRIQRGFAEMEQMVADGRNEELADMFQLCNELEGSLDIQMFFSTISDLYSLLAQFDQGASVLGMCDLIANENLTDAEAVALIMDEIVNGQCVEIDYEQWIEDHRQTSWDAYTVAIGSRQYTYQTCTQLGWYQSSGSIFQPFGSSFPVEFIFQACEDIFDEFYSIELMLQNSARLNTAFGGLNPQASNILYVHGQLDPWRSVGVQADDNIESTTVIIIEGASQSNDLGPITEDDTDAVREAKLQIMETIFGWIRTAQRVSLIKL